MPSMKADSRTAPAQTPDARWRRSLFIVLRRLAALATTLLPTVPLAGAPATDQTLYLVDCGGHVSAADLHTPRLMYHHQLSELIPALPENPPACAVANPSFQGEMLTADVLTEPTPDPEDTGYSTFAISLREWTARPLTPPHQLQAPIPVEKLLEQEMDRDPRSPLLPFSHMLDGKRILLANEVPQAGAFGLARLLTKDETTTTLAIIDRASGSTWIINQVPRAYIGNLFLSHGGQKVLVEEVAPGEEGKPTGRIVLYEVRNGKPVLDTRLPLLARGRAKVLCVSDRGSIVLAASERNRLWILQGRKLVRLNVPNDASSSCGFE